MDDQWSMGVKTGVQQLVSLDDVPEQAGNRVGQNYNSTFTILSNGSWNASVPVGRVAVLDSQFSFCHESWDMAQAIELDQPGGALIISGAGGTGWRVTKHHPIRR
jgi:hypothetical protein